MILFNNLQAFEAFSQSFQERYHLLEGVCSHQRETNQRVFGSYGRSHHRIDKDTLVEQVAGYPEGLLVIADKQRDNGRTGIAYFTTDTTESFKSVVGYVHK